MAAPRVQEQVAPEEAKMVEEEEFEERPVLDEAELLYGQCEEDLSEENRVKLQKQRELWEGQERTERQEEQDAQIALQLQAKEQQRVERPIQLGPGIAEPIVTVTARKEVR